MTATAQAVLLDTDVFSAVYITSKRTAEKRGHPVDSWLSALEGHRVLVSFQTPAEVIAGAISANWGEKRVAALREKLDATPMIGIDKGVIEAFARLTAECKHAGHALANKIHTGDR